jgi:uncharacterized membrane protein YadS
MTSRMPVESAAFHFMLTFVSTGRPVLDNQTETSAVHAPNRALIKSEDWLAVLLGSLVLAVALCACVLNRSSDFADRLTSVEKGRQHLKDLRQFELGPDDEAAKKEIKAEEEKLKKLSDGLYKNPIKPFLAEVGSWKSNPLDAFFVKVSKDPKDTANRSIVSGLFGVLIATLVLFGLGCVLRGEPVIPFAAAFVVIFVLTTASFLLAGQNVIKDYNFEYPIWALLIGMVISNTVGTPRFLIPAMRTELYIKTGLVLLGAEILLSRLLNLGLPGIFVSWVVTPITLITTYMFGQYVLRIPSKSLNMVISADMSVCGVSAAIATAAACRAKKEELSLAIGISLAFTAVMMVVMPVFIRFVGMNEVLAGAWLGGTIDSTGAVAAAGGILGPTALQVAVTVKMIQNILIGVVAFGVAVYWVMCVERDEKAPRPGVIEIWKRFPRFVIGFVGASIVFSMIYSSGIGGNALTEVVIGGTGKILRGWLFCLAFVAIGLETNFRELSHYLKDGKAITLYVCGQTLNLALTLLMAWIMFEKVFPQAAAELR